MVYVLIETAGIELVSVRVFKNKQQAQEVFTACAKENGANDTDDISPEIEGTIRMAGDDVYAVQLLQRDIH